VAGTNLIVGAGRNGKVMRASDGKVVGSIVGSDHSTPLATEDGRIIRVGTVERNVRVQRLSLAGDALKCEELFRCPSPFQNGLSIVAPLYDNGMVYSINEFGNFTAWQVTDKDAAVAFSVPCFDGMHPLFQLRNHILGDTASPILAGKRIYIMDNQGATVVLEPGSKLKVVATNKIENYLPRRWVTATQEQTYTSPICDGKNLFIRGEESLYCIGDN
jgi:hypothetical protein